MRPSRSKTGAAIASAPGTRSCETTAIPVRHVSSSNARTDLRAAPRLDAGSTWEFMVLHPKVRVCLDLSNRFVDLVAERFDLAIRYASMPLPSADIVARMLGTSRMVMVGSPALLAAHGEPAEIADLERFPALAQGTFEAIRPWAFKGPDGAAVLHHPHPRFVSDNVMALRDAAVCGIGLAQLPLDACQEALGNGDLKLLLEHRESIGTPLYAMYPSRHGMPSGVRALLTFLEERFRAVI
jgi:DNA-binding transcriptional LysR family regulator